MCLRTSPGSGRVGRGAVATVFTMYSRCPTAPTRMPLPNTSTSDASAENLFFGMGRLPACFRGIQMHRSDDIRGVESVRFGECFDIALRSAVGARLWNCHVHSERNRERDSCGYQGVRHAAERKGVGLAGFDALPQVGHEVRGGIPVRACSRERPKQGIQLFIIAAAHWLHISSTSTQNPRFPCPYFFSPDPKAFNTRCLARNKRTLRAFSLTL